MVNHIAVCGDSFGTGSGLPDDRCYEDFFGGLISKHFNLPLKVYARSGCCNFVIFLQVKKIIEEFEKTKQKPFVVITTTYHERFSVPIEDLKYHELDLSYVDYKNYTPYTPWAKPQRPIEFDIKEPKIFSQTMTNINLFLSRGYWTDTMFNIIDKKKLKILQDYYLNSFSPHIKQVYDYALISHMHLLLKQKNIPHLIMVSHKINHQQIPQSNIVEIDWGNICQQYPDKLGTGHCDERGHQLAFDKMKPIIEIFLGKVV